MKMKKAVLAMAISSIGIMDASAEVFTVNATGLSGVLSGKYSGAFNIGSQLTSANGYDAPYQITAASLSFSFSDAGLGGYTLGPKYFNGSNTGFYQQSNYFYSWERGDNITQYSRNRYDTYIQNQHQEVASAQLAVGGNFLASAQGSTSFSGGATNSNYVRTNLDGIVRNSYGYSYSCGNYTCYQPGSVSEYFLDVYESTLTWNYSSQGSRFSIFNDLYGSPYLSELSSTGYLSFDLDVTNSANLVSATLQFEAIPTPVPEPETYVLMSVGLSLMGFIARRRRDRASA